MTEEKDQKTPENEQSLIRKNQLVGIGVLAAVIAMIGLSFAAVPLYNLFCRVTGYGGTTQVAEVLPDQVLDREITIRFDANTNRNLNWEFTPQQREITMKIGERGLIAYRAASHAKEPTVGTALYNVTPLKAGKYFHKVQCFCFDEQLLPPGGKADFPVMFYVDPAIDQDPAMKDVGTITLSYTFFRAQSEALDQALEEFYNGPGENAQSPDF